MLANKSFRRLFVIAAAASMVLAFVRAAPTESVACDPCPVEPLCDLKCKPWGYCTIDRCTCKPKCIKGIEP
ncbi:hypothetical protein CPB97_000891 [Podila verticillata]|nr:hypothetical protein CPB97_000891 [Podila verticillata]